MNPAMRPPEEEWDPEYTPKSRKYYLVSDYSNIHNTYPRITQNIHCQLHTESLKGH